MHQTMTYHLGGLQGDHCRDRIEHTLSHLAGVSNVAVNLDRKTVSVLFSAAKVSFGYIEETLQTLGYSIQK